MSYIRSPYNPEGLYIWSQDDGMCHFMIGPNMIGKIPTNIFNGLIDTYIENFNNEYIEFHDACVEEVWVDSGKGNELKTRLSYEDWHIDMWDVTWYYIARSNYGRSKSSWRMRLMRTLLRNWI